MLKFQILGPMASLNDKIKSLPIKQHKIISSESEESSDKHEVKV